MDRRQCAESYPRETEKSCIRFRAVQATTRRRRARTRAGSFSSTQFYVIRFRAQSSTMRKKNIMRSGWRFMNILKGTDKVRLACLVLAALGVFASSASAEQLTIEIKDYAAMPMTGAVDGTTNI